MIIPWTNTTGMGAVERVTVTLPAEVVEEIDRHERNRSRFIAEAVHHELTRRRRVSLLRSVRNPHPETAEFADTDIPNWTPDLPDEVGLVEPTSGTAVRWGEGQRWIKEPR
jgi:hypothetical protein